MSPGPDFYCDFYCAAWDGLRGRATGRHGSGSAPLLSGVAGRGYDLPRSIGPAVRATRR